MKRTLDMDLVVSAADTSAPAAPAPATIVPECHLGLIVADIVVFITPLLSAADRVMLALAFPPWAWLMRARNQLPQGRAMLRAVYRTGCVLQIKAVANHPFKCPLLEGWHGFLERQFDTSVGRDRVVHSIRHPADDAFECIDSSRGLLFYPTLGELLDGYMRYLNECVELGFASNFTSRHCRPTGPSTEDRLDFMHYISADMMQWVLERTRVPPGSQDRVRVTFGDAPRYAILLQSAALSPIHIQYRTFEYLHVAILRGDLALFRVMLPVGTSDDMGIRTCVQIAEACLAKDRWLLLEHLIAATESSAPLYHLLMGLLIDKNRVECMEVFGRAYARNSEYHEVVGAGAMDAWFAQLIQDHRNVSIEWILTHGLATVAQGHVAYARQIPAMDPATIALLQRFADAGQR